MVRFDGEWFFPLFRYLFFPGFFTKSLDLFYNLLIFTFPLFLLLGSILRESPKVRFWSLLALTTLHFSLFAFILYHTPHDPAADPQLNQAKQARIQKHLLAQKENPLITPPLLPNWEKELSYLNSYAKLNLVLRFQQRQAQAQRLIPYEASFAEEAKERGKTNLALPSLWEIDRQREEAEIAAQLEAIQHTKEGYPEAKALVELVHNKCAASEEGLPPWIQCDFLTKLPENERNEFIAANKIVNAHEQAEAQLAFLEDRRGWLEKKVSELRYEVMPLLRPFHWEDDAGGEQALNRHINWWELTRINRKDMVAALIFGVRVSLSVGFLAITLALMIGIPIGAAAGYYGGKIDIVTYRLIEIWESMPTFFMLLMVVAFLQSKSIFLVIGVIGLFGWTGFSRFIRGEFFRQKQLPYVEACHALGFNDRYIMFSHLLPNAIPPLLTLVPFAIMGAITSEAGLSFLGLGEEGSSSWGVLMDEGRSAFPSESYLLWPPAILLTILLVSIALVGDALRDALDPKLHI